MSVITILHSSLLKTYHKVTNLSLIYLLTLGILIFIIWATFFNLEQTVTAHGQIMPEEKTQIIQAVDGGVLAELKVREGQEVVSGQILAVLQKNSAIAGYGAALAELSASQSMLVSVQEEYELTQNLLKTGDVGYLEVTRLKRQLIEIQGKVKINQAKLDQQKISLDRTDLISPVDGSIKLLKLNTIGGALKPGEQIMEIAPRFSSLLIELKVNPADIGLINIGSPASIRINTFDSSIYGTLKGAVSYISPDSLGEQVVNGTAAPFYRVHIQVPTEELSFFKQQHVDLKLGMSAIVDIKTGSRSIMRYLFKPIYRGFEGALHEK